MSGQQAPVWPKDKPLALTMNHFGPRNENHFAQGTYDESKLDEGKSLPMLFKQVRLPVTKSLILKNAVVVSPMCQYSAIDGFPTPYHLAHLGSFALHGAGTIIVEASGVTAQGRITPQDLGIWKEEHVDAHASLVSGLRSFSQNLTVGIQLAHAGRKASTWSPFYEGSRTEQDWVTEDEGGWPDEVVGPSAVGYAPNHIVPKSLSTEGVKEIKEAFVKAARRSFEAGYDFVELHAAHGYLLHSFLSPISNQRDDQYGGSLENRTRLLREIAEAIRSHWPDRSVWIRVSGSDFADHLLQQDGRRAWTIDETVELAKQLQPIGVDVLDISGGGLTSEQKIKPVPGYQVEFAKAVSALKLSNPLVATVGRMESGEHAGQLAEQTLQDGSAKLVLIARGFMTRPSWVEEAAEKMIGKVTAHNPQYHRALPVKEVERSKRDPKL